MSDVGPKLKLNEETIGHLVEAFSRGYTNKSAAAFAGIGERTLYEWLEAARTGEEPYNTMAFKIEQAKNMALGAAQECINRAMKLPECWVAAMTFLERRDPANYSLHHRARKIEGLKNLLNASSDLNYGELSKLAITALADGEISFEELKLLSEFISKSASVEEIIELKKRVENLETSIKEGV